eukprot:2079021-Pleurochrysis_carterae.AAC.1
MKIWSAYKQTSIKQPSNIFDGRINSKDPCMMLNNNKNAKDLAGVSTTEHYNRIRQTDKRARTNVADMADTRPYADIIARTGERVRVRVCALVRSCECSRQTGKQARRRGRRRGRG